MSEDDKKFIRVVLKDFGLEIIRCSDNKYKVSKFRKSFQDTSTTLRTEEIVCKGFDTFENAAKFIMDKPYFKKYSSIGKAIELLNENT